MVIISTLAYDADIVKQILLSVTNYWVMTFLWYTFEIMTEFLTAHTNETAFLFIVANRVIRKWT
jgi:hypothetical protein